MLESGFDVLDFVRDAGELKRLLDEVKPYLMNYMVIDACLIAHLQVYHVLDDQTQQTLKVSNYMYIA